MRLIGMSHLPSGKYSILFVSYFMFVLVFCPMLFLFWCPILFYLFPKDTYF